MPFHGSIVVIGRSGADGSMYPLFNDSCILGREEGCDIRVQLPTVSKKHCKIFVNDNRQVSITCLSSMATQLNGRKLEVGKTHGLSHGDIFTLGDRSFRWEYPEEGSVHIGTTTSTATTEGEEEEEEEERKVLSGSGGDDNKKKKKKTNRRDEFLRYLDEEGVIAILAKVLIRLHEEGRPKGEGMGYLEGILGSNKEENEKEEIKELRFRVACLEKQNRNLEERILKLKKE